MERYRAALPTDQDSVEMLSVLESSDGDESSEVILVLQGREWCLTDMKSSRVEGTVTLVFRRGNLHA